MLNFFAELQICSLSFGFLLASDPEEVLIDKRVDVALQIDLFLDLVHCLVQFFRIDFDAENSLLKLQIVSKLNLFNLPEQSASDSYRTQVQWSKLVV